MVIGYCFCGSFCTLSASLEQLSLLCREHTVQPIINDSVAMTDTRFGEGAKISAQIEAICQRPAIRSIKDAEPIGPRSPFDIMTVAPCTGNTLARIAAGIMATTAFLAPLIVISPKSGFPP